MIAMGSSVVATGAGGGASLAGASRILPRMCAASAAGVG